MTKAEILSLRRLLHSKTTGRVQKQSVRKKLEQYLSTVPDPVVRKSLSLYLLHGDTWQRVALKMGWQDESTPRRLCEPFLTKMK